MKSWHLITSALIAPTLVIGLLAALSYVIWRIA